MPRFTRLLWYGIVFVLLGLASGMTVAQDTASWTILVYMEADNNLEGDALSDIQEMELVGSTDMVNLVVQIDRADDYSTGDGDWTDARRYLLTQNAGDITDIVNQKFDDPDAVTLGSSPVDDLGEINNGDPQTLIDFVLWGAENFPAEKYGLILWDHGGTWSGGFGGDESTPNQDGINMPELDAALDLITESLGQNFEFIGFDTCLMGQYEVFSVLSKYANYASGSEELEPGFGWYYTPAIAALVDDPSIGGDQFSQYVVASYMGFYDDLWAQLTGETYSDYFGGDVYGQTAADLSQMAAVDAALSNFSTVAQSSMDAALVSAIGDARNNTQMFLMSSPDDAAVTASVDLMNFMELLLRFSNNAEVNAAAQDVIDAIGALVIDHQATNMPGARGLSIYFPANQRLYSTDGSNTRYAQEVPYMADWAAFLESFYGTATETASASVGRVTIQNVVSASDVTSTLYPPTIVFETEGTNINSLSFSATLQLEDGVQFMIDLSSLESATVTEDGEPIVDIPDGVSSSQYTWAVDMPVITDGSVSVPTVLLETGSDESVVVTGLYGFANGETIDSYLVFDLETQKMIKAWGINESENGGQPFEINVTAGEEFLPTWRYFDENGDLQMTTSDDVLTFSSEPFTFDFVPAESGLYEIAIFMEDVAGNTYSDSVQIQVNNDGVDSTYRGTSDVNFGYNVVYPWSWGGGVDIESDDGTVQTLYADNDGVVSVYFNFYEVASLDETEEIAFEYLDAFASDYGDEQAIMLGGYDGYIIDYQSETDDGTPIYGYVLFTYVPENATGYLIDYEVTGEGNDESVSYLSALSSSLSFFPPLADDASASGDTGMSGDSDNASNSVAAMIEGYGFTVAEIDEFLVDDGITVADLQSWVDSGEYTIAEIEEMLFTD